MIGLEHKQQRRKKEMVLEVTAMPWATIIILAIALAIAFLITGLSRLLISRLIGWDQYRSMQKETKEHQSETMKAARSNDVKQMEKLKKKQPQINAMQTKMMKPQLYLMVLSVGTMLLWWLVLLPTFDSLNVAIVPGYGGIPLFVWYLICSLFFNLLSQRIIGTNPIV